MFCDSVRLSALILLLMLTPVAGCVADLPVVGDDGTMAELPAVAVQQDNEQSDSTEPLILEFQDLEMLSLDPSWSLSSLRNLRFSLSCTGRITASVERGWDGRYRVRASDVSGETIWTYTSAERYFVSANVKVLAEDSLRVGLALYGTNGTGSLRILGEDGSVTYERSLSGTTSFLLSPAGETLALVDRLSAEMVTVDLELGQALGRVQTDAGALFRFIPGTDLILLESREAVEILDRAATPVWQQDLETSLRGGVGVVDEGRRIVLTTVDPDSGLYMFDRSAGLVWHQLLFAGGYNDLHVDADSATLLVYNVGRAGGIFLYDMDTGDPVWRYFLRLGGDGEDYLRINDVAIDGRGRVTAHLVVSENLDSGVEESHYLLLVSPSGEVKGKVFLGVNVQVQMAQDAGAVAVASGDHLASTGARVLDTLTYYDLSIFPTTSSGPAQ